LERARFARWRHGNRSLPIIDARRAHRAWLRAMELHVTDGLAAGGTSAVDAVSQVHAALRLCEELEERARQVRAMAEILACGYHPRQKANARGKPQ
jgi:hypothetical protein